MWLRLDGEGPRSRQIYRALRAAIRDGRLPPGRRVASSRELARTLGVARITVVGAYEQLLAEGHLETRRGAGTFVAPGAPPPPPRTRRDAAAAPRLSAFGARLAAERRRPLLSATPDTRRPLPYDFRYGMPSLLDFPRAAWQRCVGRSARRAPGRAYGYGAPQGASALREALAEYLARARGVHAAPEQIVIVSGSQQGLDLVARVLLSQGDAALMEEPGYEGARNAFLAAGARLRTAPVDGEGVDVRGLGLGHGLRLLYATPAHQFPLGAVLSLARRRALLDLAARASAFVIEDDYDGEYRFDGAPFETLFSLDGGARVLFLGTFSKVLFPALRLGFLVLPEALVEPVVRAKVLADGGSALLEQLALAEFLREGSFERHVRRSRARNRERREALLDAAERHLGDALEIVGANAGLHVAGWLRDLPARSLRPLIHAAAERGVGLYPIGPYYAEPPPRAGLLLGYAPLTPRTIATGIARLAEVLERFV